MVDKDEGVENFLRIIKEVNEKYRNVVFLPPSPEEMRKQLIEELTAYLEDCMLNGDSFNDAVEEVRRLFRPEDLTQRWEI